MTMTEKMWEHLTKIAAAEEYERRDRGGYFEGFPGRAIARILWPDSEGWKKVSRRHSTPAGGAMGATMPMKGAKAAWNLMREGMMFHTSTSHHQTLFHVSDAGWKALAQRLFNATESTPTHKDSDQTGLGAQIKPQGAPGHAG